MEDKNLEEEKNIMTIVNEDGTEEDVEVILDFEYQENNQEYVVYTKDEEDDKGNITVYVTRANRKDGTFKIEAIESDEEWDKIKETLRELAKKEDGEEI